MEVVREQVRYPSTIRYYIRGEIMPLASGEATLALDVR